MTLVEAHQVETQGRSPTANAYLRAVEWISDYFATPFSRAGIEQRLPSGSLQAGWKFLPAMLATVGLKCLPKRTHPGRVSPANLPCVLLGRNGLPVMLLGYVNDGASCRVMHFDGNPREETIPLKSLAGLCENRVALVAPDTDVLANRVDPQSGAHAARKSHWFWKPIRDHWSAWLQILLAAFGVNILGLALPIFVMNVYDRVIPNQALVTLWTLAGGVALALLLDLCFRILRTHVLESAGRRIDLKLASSIFRHAMSVRLLERRGGAATVASQIRDFEAVRDFMTSGSIVALIDLLFIGIFVAVLWIIVGPIAIVPLLAVPVVIIIALVSQVPIGASIDRMQQISGKKQLVLTETLLGIETVKSVNGEPVMQREWENAVAAASRINSKTKAWSNFAISSTMLIQQFVSVVIIVWGVYLVADGRITVGGLIAANQLAGRVLSPLGNISQTLVRAQRARRSLKTLATYMELPTDDSDVVESELTVGEGRVEFKQVSVTYPGSQVEALTDFSISVDAGAAIGILGRVGSGKTTVGKLMAGLIKPTSGIILVDGHEISQYESAALREGVGYLPQDPEMFTGTIAENITIGKPEASEEEINRALYYSGMDYFISENPEGLKQFVGEKGNRLSGGQRQSIAIARLLLKNPKLLFLDEPTNAMDHTTEAMVIARLAELRKEGTTLVIATHRHSLAQILDRLIVMDRGRKILEGPRNEVLKQLSTPSGQKLNTATKTGAK